MLALAPDRELLDSPRMPETSAHRRLRLLGRVNAWLSALLLGCAALGALQTWPTLLLVAYIWAGHLGFVGVLRSGRSAHWRDPSCVFAYVLFALSAVLLGSVLVPQTRLTALQVFFVIVLFDVGRLSPRQIGLVCAGALLLIALPLLDVGVAASGESAPGRLLNAAMSAPFIPLIAVIAHWVRRRDLRRARQKLEMKAAFTTLEELAQRDSLTGAWNRRRALELLEEEAKRQRRTQRPFCVGMIDIDHFKRVNDVHGHAAGDDVLRQLVNSARQHLRGADAIARWGGEEFLVLLLDTGAADAAATLDAWRAAFAAWDGSSVSPGLAVSFSAGVVGHREGVSIEQTVRDADAALYAAKRQGRNRVRAHA